MSFTVREAALADVAEMVRLFRDLGYPLEPADLAKRLQLFAASGDGALVAVAPDTPVGQPGMLGLVTLHATPVLHRAGPVGRMTALVVDERARGRGVGRALVDASVRWARSRGCVLLEVTSNRRRSDAHAFYEHLGFERSSYRFAKPLSL